MLASLTSQATRQTGSLLKKSGPVAIRGLSNVADVEHYDSGWTGDKDQYKPGTFNIKTFNKISPEVGKINELGTSLFIMKEKVTFAINFNLSSHQ